MAFFNSLSSLFSGKARRGKRAELRLREAYEAFRSGTPSKHDCDLIWVDLASVSGFFTTTAADTPAHEVKFFEGARSIFGRMLRLSQISFEEREALQRAALDEQQTDYAEGTI